MTEANAIRTLGYRIAVTPATASLVLLLLHTLGAALAALGLACVALLRAWRRTGIAATGWIAVLALAVGEGANAVGIFRVGSLLYLGPLACILAVAFGVWIGERGWRSRPAGLEGKLPSRRDPD